MPLPCVGPLALAATFDSGQVFHFTEINGVWVGALNQSMLAVEQREEQPWLINGEPEAAGHFLSLDHDLERIYTEWPDDDLSQQALALCRGIRILRQPLWECVATFITSAQKQVAHIRAISLALRERHGRETGRYEGQSIYAYPGPDQLAAVSEESLRELKLGYRAPLVRSAAIAFAEGRIDPRIILEAPKEEALAECVKIPGVGVKVANCVLLFAAGHLDAIPIDVWIRRILESHRPRGKNRTTGADAFLRRKFGTHAGYVQQYLFHYLRKTFGRRGNWEAFKDVHEAKSSAAPRRNRRSP